MSSKKMNGSYDDGQLLSFDDIMRGGESAVHQVTVPGVLKGGKPSVVNFLPASADATIRYQDEAAEAVKREKAGENPHHVERMVGMLAGMLCTPAGELMFTPEQLRQAPVNSLTEILRAVTGQTGGAPNASSEATGTASPTESLPS